MIRNYGWNLTQNLDNACEELAYDNFIGARYFLLEARKYADLSSATNEWFEGALAFVTAERDAERAVRMREAELGY